MTANTIMPSVMMQATTTYTGYVHAVSSEAVPEGRISNQHLVAG